MTVAMHRTRNLFVNGDWHLLNFIEIQRINHDEYSDPLRECYASNNVLKSIYRFSLKLGIFRLRLLFIHQLESCECFTAWQNALL